ncbi:PREDICTED: uncharacterized protein LOC101372937 [Odobenus rosmarus divergens]|uniref:Uncharacterized protein LOC101372937 n=1 Tax=Odobenus rosmarus divergens TaxID=9708 RepID=A0A9B0M268_ODORO
MEILGHPVRAVSEWCEQEPDLGGLGVWEVLVGASRWAASVAPRTSGLRPPWKAVLTPAMRYVGQQVGPPPHIAICQEDRAECRSRCCIPSSLNPQTFCTPKTIFLQCVPWRKPNGAYCTHHKECRSQCCIKLDEAGRYRCTRLSGLLAQCLPLVSPSAMGRRCLRHGGVLDVTEVLQPLNVAVSKPSGRPVPGEAHTCCLETGLQVRFREQESADEDSGKERVTGKKSCKGEPAWTSQKLTWILCLSLAGSLARGSTLLFLGCENL